MRNYLICYYAERNDDCVDCEIEIQAENINNALLIFNQSNVIFKRITKIEEI